MIRTNNSTESARGGFGRTLLQGGALALALGVLALAVPVLATWQPTEALAAPAAGDDPYTNGLTILDPSPVEAAARTQAARTPAHPSTEGEAAVLLRDWSYTDDFGNTGNR